MSYAGLAFVSKILFCPWVSCQREGQIKEFGKDLKLCLSPNSVAACLDSCPDRIVESHMTMCIANSHIEYKFNIIMVADDLQILT